MADKKVEQSSIKINGSILGIGNVTGNNSSSHVEIKFSLFTVNQIRIEDKVTELQRNPNYTALIGRAFSPHPDSTFPELEHLIGHQAELERLLIIYNYCVRQNKGAFVFLTGQYGYGTKALGRSFVDATWQGHGRAAITRFWAEKNEIRSRRDVRWNFGFQRWQEVFDLSPEFLKEESMIPFWGLFFQICEQAPWMENEPLPRKLTELSAYFRNCTQAGVPLVLLLEDFEFASLAWHKLIRYLSKEVDHGLPILWIVTMHSDIALDAIIDENRSPAQSLALELAKKNVAEIYHLSRVSKQEIENYVAPAKNDVAERLHRLTAGVPILVQNLWQDWRRTKAVFQNEKNHWEMDKASHWVEYGSGRDYIHAMLDQLWPKEDEAPWSAEQMYEMLALAAQEGSSFTVDALAKAFDVEPEKLSYALEYLLDEPDDPGLVRGFPPMILELRSANWKRTLERFEFSPLLIWFALTIYEKPDVIHFVSFAEALRETVWPFDDRVAAKIAYLYEQANQLDLARKYRLFINENNQLRKLMLQAELLLDFPKSDFICWLLFNLSLQLFENHITIMYPTWTVNFASHLISIFEKTNVRHYLGITLLLLAHANQRLGAHQDARKAYERMLIIAEELHRKDGIASALMGFGSIALSLSDYQVAREYYEKALAISQEIERKDGMVIVFGGLGEVAESFGEYQTARGYYEKMLAMAEELGQMDQMGSALIGLGNVAQSINNDETAREYYKKALASAEELERKDGIASALRGLGKVAESLGEYQTARRCYEKILILEEELAHKDGIAAALTGLGDVARSLAQYQDAREYYERALTIEQELGNLELHMHCRV